MNGGDCGSMWFVDDMALAVSTCVASIVVVDGTIEFASELVAVALLGGDAIDIAVVVDGANVLAAVDMVFTAVIFTFVLHTFSCHFFLWLHLPCPGPGMLL